LVNPKLGDTICDPACGTGGFLLGAYQHILTQHTSKEHQQTDENGLTRGLLGDKLTDTRQWTHLKEKTFYGYDMDDSMVRIGLMNLMMHGISTPNIDQKDTLSKKYDEDNFFDVIMANPPFKGSIDKGDINESFSLDTTKTELLFINRIVKSLKMGGRGGVIVPDGVLFGSSTAHKQARKMLMQNCELQGVISLPSGVFKPYAGVSTAILIFVKGGETEKVWFYNVSSDGYSLDDKRNRIKENDLPDIVDKWKHRHEQSENDKFSKFFWVDKAEIEENNYDLSINKYKSTLHKEIEYEDSKKILEKVNIMEKEILEAINNLINDKK
jgi:type I restriction enzyme M protein